MSLQSLEIRRMTSNKGLPWDLLWMYDLMDFWISIKKIFKTTFEHVDHIWYDILKPILLKKKKKNHSLSVNWNRAAYCNDIW